MSDSAPMASVKTQELRIESLTRGAVIRNQGGMVGFLGDVADLKPCFVACLTGSTVNAAQGGFPLREANEVEGVVCVATS